MVRQILQPHALPLSYPANSNGILTGVHRNTYTGFSDTSPNHDKLILIKISPLKRIDRAGSKGYDARANSKKADFICEIIIDDVLKRR